MSGTAFIMFFHAGLSKQRRNESEKRNRCSEEALYLPLITLLLLDVHCFQGRIVGKRKEKSSSEFTSLMRPFLTLSQSMLIMLCPRSTCAAASATIGSDGVLEIIYSRLLGMTLATRKWLTTIKFSISIALIPRGSKSSINRTLLLPPRGFCGVISIVLDYEFHHYKLNQFVLNHCVSCVPTCLPSGVDRKNFSVKREGNIGIKGAYNGRPNRTINPTEQTLSIVCAPSETRRGSFQTSNGNSVYGVCTWVILEFWPLADHKIRLEGEESDSMKLVDRKTKKRSNLRSSFRLEHNTWYILRPSPLIICPEVVISCGSSM